MGTPSLEALQLVVAACRRAGVEVALGGSGLLYSLGLGDSVRDWDLTTDAPREAVEQALARFDWHEAPFGDGPFRSAYRLSVQVGGAEIDLMGQFAIEAVHLPTIVTGEWQGVPVGSPEVWAVAYRLMERTPKADLLDRYLREQGARTFAVELLLREELNPNIRGQIASWPLVMS
jgi:hypothetical protein